eukprot:scaffold49602_cov63-Phaeocystis_antarctica.AAC.4
MGPPAKSCAPARPRAGFFKRHRDFLSLTSNVVEEYTLLVCITPRELAAKVRNPHPCHEPSSRPYTPSHSHSLSHPAVRHRSRGAPQSSTPWAAPRSTRRPPPRARPSSSARVRSIVARPRSHTHGPPPPFHLPTDPAAHRPRARGGDARGGREASALAQPVGDAQALFGAGAPRLLPCCCGGLRKVRSRRGWGPPHAQARCEGVGSWRSGTAPRSRRGDLVRHICG